MEESKNFIDDLIESCPDSNRALDILIEECLDLVNALRKYKSVSNVLSSDFSEGCRENVIKELVHVRISSDMVCKVLGIKEPALVGEVDRKAREFYILNC